jgi:pimeloyl-ACP methyl ester carboxylesterase
MSAHLEPDPVDERPTLLLVHGSWQGAWSWEPVRARLHAAGYRTLAPTLPGHTPGDDRSKITHADYVTSVLDVLDAAPDIPMVLVGHSFGGTVISRVAELRPECCRMLVYYSAFVPCDGEPVDLPAQFLDTIRQLAMASPDRSIALPYEAFRSGFANTASETEAERIYARLTPEPFGPVVEPIPLPRFDALDIPSVYISCRQDRTMPPGHFHPRQSSRLRQARLIEVDGDHEALLTAPDRLTEAILTAVGPLRRATPLVGTGEARD